ncbi:MAG: ATP-binding cassette domain-containing protein [Rhodospirillum sp.]|nr:ATP-binding cassette domain-containing protein [Rhodospirillum sp.]
MDDEDDEGLAPSDEAEEEDVRPKVSDRSWALRDITFEAKAGDVIGLIGNNGSGKTTLLNLIMGATLPSEGKIEGSGLVLSFNQLKSPVFGRATGRRNLQMLSEIFRLDKARANALIAQACDFADAGDFIDLPADKYSAGMYTRLSFSFGLAMNPSILLLDEMARTGDPQFSEKFQAALIAMLQDKTRIVLLATHKLKLVRQLCTRALWIEKGLVVMDSFPNVVCDAFINQLPAEETPRRLVGPVPIVPVPAASETDLGGPSVAPSLVDWPRLDPVLKLDGWNDEVLSGHTSSLLKASQSISEIRTQTTTPNQVTNEAPLGTIGRFLAARFVDDKRDNLQSAVPGEILVLEVLIQADAPMGTQLSIQTAVTPEPTLVLDEIDAQPEPVIEFASPHDYRLQTPGEYVIRFEIPGSLTANVTTQVVLLHTVTLTAWHLKRAAAGVDQSTSGHQGVFHRFTLETPVMGGLLRRAWTNMAEDEERNGRMLRATAKSDLYLVEREDERSESST